MSTAKRHHWVVRWTHWVNAVALTLMIGSGLRIFQAYPAFARKGETFCCYPLEGTPPPRWLTFGGGLAGARNWHFAMMWVLAVNGFAYLAFIYLHGEWRDLVPRRGDLRDTWQMVRFYLYLRRDHPHQGKHNALQKAAYFTLPMLGVLAVLTGLAIWKPVQLAPLAGLFGGYVWARYWHFLVMMALVVMAAGHVFMVFAVDPASLPSMVTGRYDESQSPEARNARPFHRGPKRQPVPSPTAANQALPAVSIPSPSSDPHPGRAAPPKIINADAADSDPSHVVSPAGVGAITTERHRSVRDTDPAALSALVRDPDATVVIAPTSVEADDGAVESRGMDVEAAGLDEANDDAAMSESREATQSDSGAPHEPHTTQEDGR
jgi:Ni/Fe-hydrogenase b-type cytochrome subunit